MRPLSLICAALAAAVLLFGQPRAEELGSGFSSLRRNVRSASSGLSHSMALERESRLALENAGPGLNDLFDEDVPQTLRTQVGTDLALVRAIEGGSASDLHQGIFGPVDGAGYMDFFKSRIKSIGLDDCGNPIAIACVKAFFYPNKMWFTENYSRYDHPAVGRLLVIFHEARHTEWDNRNWPHARCPSPFKDENGEDMRSIFSGALLQGQPACDVTPVGSYGSSLIMLKNIAKHCSNCTDKLKMDAELYADDQLGRIIAPKAKKAILDDLYR